MAGGRTTAGTFGWHEQVSPHPEEAKRFSTQRFGWDAEVFKLGEVDYTMIPVGGQAYDGFGRAMQGAPR